MYVDTVWYIRRAIEANIVHIYDRNVCYIIERPFFRVELPVFILEEFRHRRLGVRVLGCILADEAGVDPAHWEGGETIHMVVKVKIAEVLC